MTNQRIVIIAALLLSGAFPASAQTICRHTGDTTLVCSDGSYGSDYGGQILISPRPWPDDSDHGAACYRTYSGDVLCD